MGIKELLQKRNDPDGYFQLKMKSILLELENIKEEAVASIRKEVEKAKQGVMFSDTFLDPAKRIAEQTARAEISDVKAGISEKVEAVLAKIDTKTEDAFAKIEGEAEATVERVSKHLDAITEDFKSNLNGEIAGIKATVENMRGPEGKVGENGRDGKDAQDIDPKSVVPLVLAQIQPDKPNTMVDKINTATNKIRLSLIEGLMQELSDLRNAIMRLKTNQKSAGGGGGMGAVINQQFDGNASDTTFALTYDIAGNSTAVIGCRYNGQMLYLGDQFTISGKVLTTTFVPAASTKVEITYIRS